MPGQCGLGIRAHKKDTHTKCKDQEEIPGGRRCWGARIENNPPEETKAGEKVAYFETRAWLVRRLWEGREGQE